MNRWTKFIHLLLAGALVCTQAVQAQMIRGTPGVDYPDYPSIPETSFRCSDQTYNPGFYADPETQCQVFHFCFNHRHESFLCPAGTIFNQAILACDSWYTSNCSMAPMFYSVNFGPVLEKAGKDIPMLLKLRDRAGINFQPSATTEHVLDKVSPLYETSTRTSESSDNPVSDNRVDDGIVEPEIKTLIQDSGNETVSTGNRLEDGNSYPQNDQNMYANEEYYESEYKNLNENQWGQLSYPYESQTEVFFDGKNYYSYDQSIPDYAWRDSQPSEEFRTFYEDYSDKLNSFDRTEDGFQVDELAEPEYVTESLYGGEGDEVLIDPMQEFSKRLLQNKRRRRNQYVVMEEEPEEEIPVRSRVKPVEEEDNLRDHELLSVIDLAAELPLKLESKSVDEERKSEDFQFIEIPDEPKDFSDSQSSEDDVTAEFDSNEQRSDEAISKENTLLPDGQDASSRGEEIDDLDGNIQNDDSSLYADEKEDSDRLISRQDFPRWSFEQFLRASKGSSEVKIPLTSNGLRDGGFEIPDETEVQEAEDKNLIFGAGPEFFNTLPGENYNFIYSEVEEIPGNYVASGIYSDENDRDFYDLANYYAIYNNPYPSQFDGMEYSSQFWQSSVGPGQVTRYIPPYYTSRVMMSDESQDFQPTDGYGIVQAVTEVPGFAGMDSVATDVELKENDFSDSRDSFRGYDNYDYGYYIPPYIQPGNYRNYDSQLGYLNDQVYGDAFSENTGYSYELDGSSNFVGSPDADMPEPSEEFDRSVENLLKTGDHDSSLTENYEAFSDEQSDEPPNADPEFPYDSNDFLEIPENLGLNYGKENDDTLYVFDFEDETSDSQISEGESPEDQSFETLNESPESENFNLQNENEARDETVASNIAKNLATGTVTEAKVNTSIKGIAKTISTESAKDEKPVTLSSAVKHLSGLKPSVNLPLSENRMEDFAPPSENMLLNSMFPNQMNFNPYMYGANMGQFGVMDSSNTVPFSRSGSVQAQQSGQQGKVDKSKLASIQERLRSMTRGKFGAFKKLMKSNS